VSQVTIKYQGSIPKGQNEFFCFFGLRRVTSSHVYYDPSDDSLVRVILIADLLVKFCTGSLIHIPTCGGSEGGLI
jgi:hypothetical protein